ncbi:MAG: xanthine dehydrogenase family protein molybdopterin-binding subunit [Candidatus Methylomirabilia bacterium]
MARREDHRYLTGQGQYLDDLVLRGLVHAAFVRSPFPHARVRRVDLNACRSLPGVLDALDGAEAAQHLRPIRSALERAGSCGEWWPLARDRVRFPGEAVAAIVATDRYLAEDAAWAVRIEYDPLPALPDVLQAASPDALELHPEVAGNTFLRATGSAGDASAVCSRAPVVVRAELRTGRVTGAAIENRGVLAHFDRGSHHLRVWSSTQVPHLLRVALAEQLGLDETLITVLAPDVGGAFGIKMHLFPEELTVALLALRLGRPVKWVERRQENFQASIHAHEQRLRIELAANQDGRIQGLKARVVTDAGAYSAYPITAGLEPLGAAASLPGPYDIADYEYEAEALATTKCPVGAYRGVGQVMATFARERLIDLLARRLKLDPAEVRRRNLIPPERLPYTNPAGLVYDTGDYPACFERALAAADYTALRRQVEELRGQGRRAGIGLACFVEYTAVGASTYRRRGMREVPGYDAATIRISPSGHAQVFVSSVSQGQGHATTLGQLAADALGFPLDAITLVSGDTDRCPFGSGTFASRGAAGVGDAVLLAARSVREKAVRIAALLLEADAHDVEAADGRFQVRGAPDRFLPWSAVARAAHYPPVSLLNAGGEPGLEATRGFSPTPTFSYATHVAAVEVDHETGQVSILRYLIVEDCGPMINPTVVEGQTAGGVTQGIGVALLEALVYDETCQLTTASLMDYALPTVAEALALEIHHLETPSPTGLGGFKGVGESGTIGAPAAIANAVADALGSAGDGLLELPMTRERIWQAIRAGGG